MVFPEPDAPTSASSSPVPHLERDVVDRGVVAEPAGDARQRERAVTAGSRPRRRVTACFRDS